MINSKLNTVEATGLLMLIMANKIILNLPEQIISSAGSAAWINCIYIILITFIFITILFKLLNPFSGKDIIDISSYVGSSLLKNLIGITQILILFLITNTIIRSFSYTLKTIYFTRSPIIFIVLFMIVPVIISIKCGLKSISKICLYILPIAYIGLAILLLAPTKDFEVQRLFPILGYGFNTTFLSGISNLFALSGIGYIYLLPPLLKETTRIRKISIISLILSSIALFFSVLCILLVFGFHINTNENMTLYLLTMVVHHGNIIHGINILFMIVWILSILAYISITVFFITFVLNKITDTKNSQILNIAISFSLVPCSIVFQNNPLVYAIVQRFLCTITNGFIFIICPLILILANIKHKVLSHSIMNNFERKIS